MVIVLRKIFFLNLYFEHINILKKLLDQSKEHLMFEN